MVVILVLSFFLLHGQVMAQESLGSLQGTVRSQTRGESLADAEVRAKNLVTGAVHTAVTNNEGKFQIPALPPGRYELRVSRAGFGTEVQPAIQIAERQSVTSSFVDAVRKTNGVPAAASSSGTAGTPDTASFTRAPFGGAVAKEKLLHPTLTRRMQFYLDHDWFIEAGEALPVHRPHPTLGGDYPLHQTGGHGRESIHTLWITNPLILRLTRGVPSLLVNPATAEQMGILDYEEVEVYNDAGLYRARVKHSSLVRPNQVIIYHCWEKYQLSKGHWQAVNPCIAKPLLLAGKKMAQGYDSPVRLLQGNRTRLATPHGIALDTKDRLLFVTNHGSVYEDGCRGSR